MAVWRRRRRRPWVRPRRHDGVQRHRVHDARDWRSQRRNLLLAAARHSGAAEMDYYCCRYSLLRRIQAAHKHKQLKIIIQNVDTNLKAPSCAHWATSHTTDLQYFTGDAVFQPLSPVSRKEAARETESPVFDYRLIQIGRIYQLCDSNLHHAAWCDEHKSFYAANIRLRSAYFCRNSTLFGPRCLII